MFELKPYSETSKMKGSDDVLIIVGKLNVILANKAHFKSVGYDIGHCQQLVYTCKECEGEGYYFEWTVNKVECKSCNEEGFKLYQGDVKEVLELMKIEEPAVESYEIMQIPTRIQMKKFNKAENQYNQAQDKLKLIYDEI